MKNERTKLLVDCAFLGFSLVVFATGLVLFFCFHVEDGSWRTEALGFERLTWLNLHRLTAMLAGAAMIAHIVFNLRSLIFRFVRPGRRKSETAMVLSFFVVVTTGYALWLCVNGSSPLLGPATIGPQAVSRHVWVDLHNFSGFAALPLVVLHVVRHFRWMKRNLRVLYERQRVSKSLI